MSYLNGNLPTQGSHFSDGVRVGKVMAGSGYVQVSGDLTDAQKALYAGYRSTSPYGYTKGANGVLISPRYMYVTQPLEPQTNSLSLVTSNVPANAYLTLAPLSAGSPPVAYTTRANVGITQTPCIAFDVAQAVSATRVSTSGPALVSVWGFDYGEVPMYEEITIPNLSTTAIGKKAFKYVSNICVSTTDTWSAGGSIIYGIPYYFPDFGFVLGSTMGGNTLGMSFFNPGTALNTIATATTGDVRGTVNLAGAPAPNGLSYLCINMFVQGATDNTFLPAASIPAQTPQGLYGVPQFTRPLKVNGV